MPMKNMSDLTMMNLDTGIEGILQGVAEGSSVGANDNNPAPMCGGRQTWPCSAK